MFPLKEEIILLLHFVVYVIRNPSPYGVIFVCESVCLLFVCVSVY
jgi:hypothetical protein